MNKDTPLISDDRLRAICEELDENIPSTPFIENAHLLIYETYSKKSTFSTERLALIELYLAAHFVAITYPPTAFEGVGKLQQSVQYKLGFGLQNTKYGQQALLLSEGTLLGKKVSISWVGSVPRG